MRPEVRRAREHFLSERQDSFDVELVERRRVAIDARQREFLTQSVALTRVGVVVDGLSEQESIIETVELLLDRVSAAFGHGCRDARFFLERVPNRQNVFLHQPHEAGGGLKFGK
jgi:hypothetical protein